VLPRAVPTLSAARWLVLLPLPLLFVPGTAQAMDAASSGSSTQPGSAAAPQVAPAAAPFDPLKGITANGMIPEVLKPADLPDPERWRFIPAGRIPPGNFFERFLQTAFAGPFVYYDQEVGAGAGVSITDIDFRQQRRRELASINAATSTLGQTEFSIDWERFLAHRDLPDGGVLQEERSWERVDIGYNRVLTRSFYGFGPNTAKSDQTSFTDEEGYAGAQWQHSLPRAGDDTVLTLGGQWQHHNLATGHVTGAPSTDAVYPALVAGVDGNDSAWVTIGLAYDTRDSQHNPYHGWDVGLTLDAAPLSSSSHEGGILTARGSAVVPVGGIFHDHGQPHEEDPPTDVLAIGGFVQGSYGNLPFFDLPSLGGDDTLRAYVANRFTDHAAWHCSLEYRVWVLARGVRLTRLIAIERLGVAPFVDVGSVAGNVGGLLHARPHESVGIGMRAMVERASLFRFDVGFWRDSSSFSGGYGLTF